ncbi:hemerythrin-like metal-binding domain-containing protein [Azoarcus sp. CIB]|uniref:bacteriohemerythrin n=1 Tax=Aromatoleum sp. (strain CIB) TaxID=198107 RepID=UPI00067B796F|nr:bacteriohemerythrin [Azoarcus sp. CIB]AKU10523.1 hemerythrin-like metal-binding domain-containing protein [Azoarcus sp. CIB]
MSQVLFEWSDSFNVGIQEIDEQHRILVDLLNQLHAAIRDHKGSQACRAILDQLAEYTRTHFLLEESLMRVSHYSGLDLHKQQHEDLIAQVKSLQDKLDSGQASISFELLHFLQVWLTKHINESDKRFGNHFVRNTDLKGYSEWSEEVKTTMKKKKWWWKFW